MKRRFAALLTLAGLASTGCGNQEPITSVTVNPDGSTTIKAPGVNVQSGPNGANVEAPGVKVQSGPDGANVQAPGVDVQAKP